MEQSQSFIQTLGLISAVGMPLWNIPLVIKIYRRRSSKDISLLWTLGVWACILGMLPQSLISQDIVLRSFGIVNVVFFTAVVVVVLKFRKSPPHP